MLTLFRGDDLAFAEFDRKVCVRLNSSQDLTGWCAKFCLYDNVKQTADISSRLWTFGYSAEETQVFPLGKTFGRLVIIDNCGRIRQLTKVEVEVVDQKLEPCIAGTIAISVDNVIADYNNMGNKPFLNGKVISGSHDAAYYGLATAEDVEPLPGLIDTVQMMSAAVADHGESIANNFVKLIELQARIDNLPPYEDYSQQIDALNARVERQEAALIPMQEDIESLGADIGDERQDRESAFTSLIEGETLISKLLFSAEGDDENNYRMRIVLRNDGSGHMLPTIALDAVQKEEDSGDDSSSEV